MKFDNTQPKNRFLSAKIYEITYFDFSPSDSTPHGPTKSAVTQQTHYGQPGKQLV
jgi:hypothetical protein